MKKHIKLEEYSVFFPNLKIGDIVQNSLFNKKRYGLPQNEKGVVIGFVPETNNAVVFFYKANRVISIDCHYISRA